MYSRERIYKQEACYGCDPTKDRHKAIYGRLLPVLQRVRNELERLGLDYEVVDADADMREEVIRLSGQRAIPILTIGDEVLVDSSHIIRELRNRYA